MHKHGELPKRVITRRLKKQVPTNNLLGDAIDLVVSEVDMLEPLDENEVAVSVEDEDEVVEEVSVPLVTDDGVTSQYLGEVTVIQATSDEQVHEIQL